MGSSDRLSLDIVTLPQLLLSCKSKLLRLPVLGHHLPIWTSVPTFKSALCGQVSTVYESVISGIIPASVFGDGTDPRNLLLVKKKTDADG